MVAQGWNQVPGQDCGSTFAPVCRLQSVRKVLAIAAEMDWEFRQLNVKTAFLYADIEEEVIVAEAPDFETNDANKRFAGDEAWEKPLWAGSKPWGLVSYH